MARGGARFGAGRPAYKAKGEYLHRVDVRIWARREMLDSYGSFTWSWNRGGEPMGRIGVLVEPKSTVTLQYTLPNDGEARHINERVRLQYTPCHFGGARPWFHCPRCAAKVAVLYLRGGRFACRHCQRVAYSSQSEDVMARTWRKQGQLEAKLADDWQRPKGMRHATYARLMDRLTDCEQRRDEAFCVAVARLMGENFMERFRT